MFMHASGWAKSSHLKTRRVARTVPRRARWLKIGSCAQCVVRDAFLRASRLPISAAAASPPFCVSTPLDQRSVHVALIMRCLPRGGFYSPPFLPFAVYVSSLCADLLTFVKDTECPRDIFRRNITPYAQLCHSALSPVRRTFLCIPHPFRRW